MPGVSSGPPANKGKKYPPVPPSQDEIGYALSLLPDDAQGWRLRVLIMLLSGFGVGLKESLLLERAAVSAQSLVRVDGRSRLLQHSDTRTLQHWLVYRDAMPGDRLLCVVRGPTKGEAWNAASARQELSALAKRAGVKSLGPQQLRHAFTVAMTRRGVPLASIRSELGLKPSGDRAHVPVGVFAASEPERTIALQDREWRVGRRVGRTVYAMYGEKPSDDDPLIGMMDTPELAQAVVAAHNAFFD